MKSGTVRARDLHLRCAIGWLGLSLLLAPSASIVADTPQSPNVSDQSPCGRGQQASDLGCITPPELVKRVQPEMPEKARKERVDGTVILWVLVLKDGTVERVMPLKNSRVGYGYEEAAERAVRQWGYKPAYVGDGPIDYAMTTVIDFQFK